MTITDRKPNVWLDVSAAELAPGDVWEAGEDRVVIATVTLAHHPELDAEVVRVGGRIEEGFGRGTAVRSWTFLPAQRLEVIR